MNPLKALCILLCVADVGHEVSFKLNSRYLTLTVRFWFAQQYVLATYMLSKNPKIYYYLVYWPV